MQITGADVVKSPQNINKIQKNDDPLHPTDPNYNDITFGQIRKMTF